MPAGLHRLQNIHIAAAAAQISGQIMANCIIIRIGVFGQQSHRRQDEPRRAIGALKGGVIEIGLLYRMELTLLGQTFNGSNFFTCGLYGQNQTTTHRPAIQQNGAGPAHSDPAALTGTN